MFCDGNVEHHVEPEVHEDRVPCIQAVVARPGQFSESYVPDFGNELEYRGVRMLQWVQGS